MLRGVDEHQMKRRSFAFYLAYIKCFRTYSVYLSLRLPAQILYAGIHLPPQREARALPRRAPKLTASERKIVTKETHQRFVFVQVAFACKGEPRALRRRCTDSPLCESSKIPDAHAGLLAQKYIKKHRKIFRFFGAFPILSTERAQNQYFIIMATQPPCSRRFSVVKPASRQAFSTSSARVSIIPEIINVPPLTR